LLATLFSFSLGLFMNNCYTRFKDNWMSAMKGWSRLNDLGLQIFAYVADRELACDVIRLMHAANHLCYADFAGFNAIELCRRRHLLTEREVRLLSLRNGPAPFYLCSCWALEKLAKAPNLKETYVLAMDRSVREWRQNTTLLPLMQLTPLPLPYYRVMVALLILFEFVVGLKMAIGVEHYEHESWWWAAELLSFLLFALISLVAQSLILVSIQLLDPWGKDALDLPAEEYLLLPLAGHRKLFAAPAADADEQLADVKESFFLSPWATADSEMLATFARTVTAQGKQLTQKNFRRLDRWNTRRLLVAEDSVDHSKEGSGEQASEGGVKLTASDTDTTDDAASGAGVGTLAGSWARAASANAASAMETVAGATMSAREAFAALFRLPPTASSSPRTPPPPASEEQDDLPSAPAADEAEPPPHPQSHRAREGYLPLES